MIVGITGSIGSGKSTVLAMLNEHYGVPTIDADDIILDLFSDPRHSVYRFIIGAIGSKVQVVSKGGVRIDRDILRDALTLETRRIIDAKIIPYVWERVKLFHQSLHQRPMAFGCSRLFESDFPVDTSVLVFQSDINRQLNLAVRRGTSREIVNKIHALQFQTDYKKQFADVVIDNSGSLEQLSKAVDNIHRTLFEPH